MNVLEVFAGAGGLAYGLKEAGWEHSYMIEQNKHAHQSLLQNFSCGTILKEDVTSISYEGMGAVTLVSGGPPCQPFSLGGKAMGYDDRRDLFPHAVRTVRIFRPKAFLFENVKGLLRKSFETYFKYILLQLSFPAVFKKPEEDWKSHFDRLSVLSSDSEELSYTVSHQLLNAADYGIPQKRERVIIVGIRSDLGKNFYFPPKTHSKERLFWDQYVTGTYWKRHGIARDTTTEEATQIRKKVEKLSRKYGMFAPPELPWRTVRDALEGLPVPDLSEEIYKDHQYRAGAKIYPGHTGSYIDEPSKTIKAGNHGVPGGENMIRFEDGSVRYYTLLEAKRIQTFPDNYVISGAWTEGMRQLGNAVPVELGYVLGKSLYHQIEDNLS